MGSAITRVLGASSRSKKLVWAVSQRHSDHAAPIALIFPTSTPCRRHRRESGIETL